MGMFTSKHEAISLVEPRKLQDRQTYDISLIYMETKKLRASLLVTFVDQGSRQTWPKSTRDARCPLVFVKMLEHDPYSKSNCSLMHANCVGREMHDLGMIF